MKSKFFTVVPHHTESTVFSFVFLRFHFFEAVLVDGTAP